MAYWKKYHTPQTVSEALELLQRYEGQARLIGGGTDLLLEIQQGHRPAVEALIDPSRITGLDQIVTEESHIIIGAGVTHSTIVQSPVLQQQGTCLVESCGVIGGPQVRNVATLAGNIAHALPAGDGTIGMLALGGDVEIASAAGPDAAHTGTSWVPMQETFLGPGKSTIDPTTMLITRVRFPMTNPGEGSAFRRVMRPQGVALPMISMAARIHVEKNVVTEARVAIGPAGIVPFLSEKGSAVLVNQPPSQELWHAVSETILEEAHFRTSKHRATAAYRQEMIRSQLVKVLAKAAERAEHGNAIPEGVGQ